MCSAAAHFDSLEDSEIIASIISGEKEAISYLLIERCGPKLNYLCSYKFKSLGMEFPEMISETYETLSRNEWKVLRDFKGQNAMGVTCKLSNYVSLIMSRILYKRIKIKLKETDNNLPLINIENDLSFSQTDENLYISHDIVDAVMALENEHERQVILLYKIKGYSVEEVCQLLGITPANLYTICNRAMSHLRSILEVRGYHG
jgi:RNA polymerase sigma factor (sigma-70 family)